MRWTKYKEKHTTDTDAGGSAGLYLVRGEESEKIIAELWHSILIANQIAMCSSSLKI